MSRDYWLWLGPIVDARAVLTEQGVSPAGNRWQRELVEALVDRGQDVEVVGYTPAPLFPRGPLVLRRYRQQIAGFTSVGGAYVNLPVVRHLAAFASTRRAVHLLQRRRGSPRVVFSYNAPPALASLAIELQRTQTIPWVAVVADPPGTLCRLQMRSASGRVFLSYGSYMRAGKGPKLHLDGGIRSLQEGSAPSRRALMFSGSLSRYAGLDLLLEAFALVRDTDVELWVTGKGNPSTVLDAAARDSRIKYFGVLPEDELAELSKRCFAFVNPRLPDNDENFPSKVLHYLQYGRPVVSTWTAGLSPEYEDVLFVVGQPTPLRLAETLRRVLTLDAAELEATRVRATSFATSHRWSERAALLTSWAAALEPRSG